jgi:hypothetical protein
MRAGLDAPGGGAPFTRGPRPVHVIHFTIMSRPKPGGPAWPRWRRIGCPSVDLDAERTVSMAGRPIKALTRRDVARALLTVPAVDALAALPGLRRQLMAAGNPLSAAFWDGAAATLQEIADGSATVGDVENWLEATGTEPARMIGMLVWDDEDDRSPLQAEMHGLLVAHLEELLAAGEIDPDGLAAEDAAALREHRRRQEEWMMSPLPDGRIPMWAVTDEEDDEFLAQWDAAEAEALAELRAVLGELPGRDLPEAELRAACGRLRSVMKQPGGPRELLAACAGVDPESLPGDDAELWLTLAAGIVAPRDELQDDDETGDELDGIGDLSEDEEAMVALCTLDHNDWLAAASALAEGGPGTPAAADDLARYVSEYDPDDIDDQADAAAAMFLHVVSLWRVLGAVDDSDRLTPLGWWGLPEAVQWAWTPRQ